MATLQITNNGNQEARKWWVEQGCPKMKVRIKGTRGWHIAGERIQMTDYATTYEFEVPDVVEGAVKSPKHYALKLNDGRDIECIHVIEALNLDWHLGNAFKYIWRAGKKDPTKLKEDLEKAVEILTRKIALLGGDK